VTKLFPAAAILAIGLLTTAAFAAGGTSTSSNPAPSATTSVPKRPVVLLKKKTVVAKKVEQASTTTDLWAAKFGDLGPAYLAAVNLAQSAKYEDAIKAFNGLNKPDDPRVLNWIGFSLRKMGKVDEAMPYYDKALSKAPDFTPAHEYLGEAYLQMKDVAKAKDQLALIEKLCANRACEEYKDLSEAIAKTVL